MRKTVNGHHSQNHLYNDTKYIMIFPSSFTESEFECFKRHVARVWRYSGSGLRGSGSRNRAGRQKVMWCHGVILLHADMAGAEMTGSARFWVLFFLLYLFIFFLLTRAVPVNFRPQFGRATLALLALVEILELEQLAHEVEVGRDTGVF